MKYPRTATAMPCGTRLASWYLGITYAASYRLLGATWHFQPVGHARVASMRDPKQVVARPARPKQHYPSTQSNYSCCAPSTASSFIPPTMAQKRSEQNGTLALCCGGGCTAVIRESQGLHAQAPVK
jgi:hypothetical protein